MPASTAGEPPSPISSFLLLALALADFSDAHIIYILVYDVLYMAAAH
jgi:hypothetical protein